METEKELLVKEKEFENSYKEMQELKEQYSKALDKIEGLSETQQETVETFSAFIDAKATSNSDFENEFLEIYKRNSSEIIELLKSISGSAITLEEQTGIANQQLTNVVNTGFVGIAGLGFIVGAIMMSVFSRYFKH